MTGHWDPVAGSRSASNPEGGAFSGFAVHVDLAAVRLRNPGHETEPQAETAFGILVGARDPVEAVEDVRQMRFRNADTGVGYGQDDGFWARTPA